METMESRPVYISIGRSFRNAGIHLKVEFRRNSDADCIVAARIVFAACRASTQRHFLILFPPPPPPPPPLFCVSLLFSQLLSSSFSYLDFCAISIHPFVNSIGC